MTETSGLIQMTVHDVAQGYAHALIVVGLIVAALGALLMLCAAAGKDKGSRLRWVLIFGAVALAGTVMAATGARQPRQRLLYCCASGPVSLEDVAVRYDIVEVDGKLLVLAER